MRKWSEIRSSMPPEDIAAVDQRVSDTIASMPLDKIRRARELTQVAVAERLDLDQGAVSRMERRTDMYLSTLREYIEALGGNLELRADFPDGSINIDLHEVR